VKAAASLRSIFECAQGPEGCQRCHACCDVGWARDDRTPIPRDTQRERSVFFLTQVAADLLLRAHGCAWRSDSRAASVCVFFKSEHVRCQRLYVHVPLSPAALLSAQRRHSCRLHCAIVQTVQEHVASAQLLLLATYGPQRCHAESVHAAVEIGG
jgi:hypothetical protein